MPYRPKRFRVKITRKMRPIEKRLLIWLGFVVVLSAGFMVALALSGLLNVE
jgi:hypothetical protein